MAKPDRRYVVKILEKDATDWCYLAPGHPVGLTEKQKHAARFTMREAQRSYADVLQLFYDAKPVRLKRKG